MKPFYFFILFLAVSCQHSAVSCQETVSSNVIDFRTAVDMMLENNATIKAAEKSTLLAKRQSQLINASWLPTITMTADYTMIVSLGNLI